MQRKACRTLTLCKDSVLFANSVFKVVHTVQLLWIMRTKCMSWAQLMWALNWHLVTHWAGSNLINSCCMGNHYKFSRKDNRLASEHYFILVRSGHPLLSSHSLLSCNWPDHHRIRWVESFGLLWGVWTGRASHQNTSKDSSVPRVLAGHIVVLQTGP